MVRRTERAPWPAWRSRRNRIGRSELVGRIRAHTDLPICAGIGVSNAEQAAAVAGFADGAIVGTALVRRLGDAGLDGLRALTAELAEAVHTGRH